jgi:hypothetical protein
MGSLCIAMLLALLPAAASAANSDCLCVPTKILPGGNLAQLRNVATGGKASKVAKSVTVRLSAQDVTPGSCTSGESSDPVTATLMLVDDDGEVILNNAKPGFVCKANSTTNAKFTAIFEGPKNCEDSAVPVVQSTGKIDVIMMTDDGVRNATRKIQCAATIPVEFEFSKAPNFHVNEGSMLTFTVSAKRKNVSKTVTVSGQPLTATFNGTNFSWVGEFEAVDDTGRHEMTFMADGEEYPVTIGTTESELLTFEMVDSTGETIVAPLPVPVGGQAQGGGRGLFFSDLGPTPIAGRGTNSWAAFVWSVDDESLADFFTTTNVAVIEGLASGTTQFHAHFTDADLGLMTASATMDILEVISVSIDPSSISFPNDSTEPLTATATLLGGSQTQTVNFSWSSSNDSVATVTGGSQLLGTAHIGNVTGQALGSATISASSTLGSIVTGMASVTLVAPLRNQ